MNAKLSLGVIVMITLSIGLLVLILCTPLINASYALDSKLTNHSSQVSLLDPSPVLVDKQGNIQNNVTLASSINTTRIGTISDGVSKSLIKFPHDTNLEFSLEDKNSNDLTDGTLSNLLESSNNSKRSSITVEPKLTSNGTSVLLRCTRLRIS